jgi:hypothetical protein
MAIIALSLWLHLTSNDVLSMMQRVPPGGYERGADAIAMAEAIAELADGSITGDVWGDAALEVVYAAMESGNRHCAVGDGGKSLGYLQLQRASRAVACNPRQALAEWIRRAKEILVLCAANEPDERLAALASGSCDRGRAVVRRRAKMARALRSDLVAAGDLLAAPAE